MVEEELKSCKINFTTRGEYLVTLCPFHEDSSPSLRVHHQHGGYHCFVCSATGPLYRLIAARTGEREESVKLRMDVLYGRRRPIKPEIIGQWHADIWTQTKLLGELSDRGISPDLIKQAMLGYKDGRIAIPIKDFLGEWVTAKFYKPGAPDKKMIGMKGRASKAHLYPFGQVIKYDTIVIAGGEIKALCGTALFNPHGIGVVSTTAGEGKWAIEHNEFLRGKKIYIAYDVDRAGQVGAKTVKEALQGEDVSIVDLPFKYKIAKGGLDDWIVRGGTVEEFLAAVRTSEEPPEIPEEPAVASTLEGCYDPTIFGKKITLKATISAAQDTPMMLPASWQVECGMDQQEKCAVCRVRLVGNEFSVDKDDAMLLSTKPEEEMKRVSGITHSCKAFSFKPKQYYAVTDLRLGNPLELTGDRSIKTAQPAMLVQDAYKFPDTQLTYEVQGRVHAHPLTKQATLTLSELEPADDDLSLWEMSEDDVDFLTGLKGTVEERMRTLELAVERQITQIHNRAWMHYTMLLTYASPLFLDYGDRRTRGWMECLILGDSSTGKSWSAERLMEAIGLGIKIDCCNATRTGLLGGNVRMEAGGKFFIKWGALVQQDRRLLVLEELKELAVELIGALKEARSSGIAEMTMAEHRKAHCRTRIIATSNPRGRRALHTYPYGVSALLELVGSPEDLRRFDLCCVVPNKSLNKKPSDDPTPELDARRLLRLAVLNSWTSIPATDGLELISYAEKLTSKFCAEIPVVDPGSTDLKLLRVAAACASLTGSLDDEYRIKVTQEHVEWAYNFLDEMYSSDDLGYAAYSESAKAQSEIDEVDEGNIIEEMRNCAADKFNRLVAFLRGSEFIDERDVSQFAACSISQAEMLVGELRAMKCLRRAKGSYVKTDAFSQLLRKLND